MPRGKQKKTMSGAPGQNIKSVPGQRYGEGQAQTQMQKAMPAPDEMRNEQQRAPQVSAPQPEQQPVPAQPRVSPQDYLSQLPTGLLRQPPTPNVPVTNGLRSGAGAGPEALDQYRQMQPSTRMLYEMYRRSNNPLYLEMMNRFGR